MEVLMDDPDLISLSSISDSTDCSSNSNLSFHSVAIMLSSKGKKTAARTRKALGATTPSKNNNNKKSKSKTAKKPVDDKEVEEEVEEVPPPTIVNDPIAGATVSNVVIGTKPIPIKRFNVKKKKLTDANSSLIQSINGIPPIDISVDCLRKFCARESIPGLGSSASKLKCIQGIISAKNNPDVVIKKKSENAAKKAHVRLNRNRHCNVLFADNIRNGVTTWGACLTAAQQTAGIKQDEALHKKICARNTTTQTSTMNMHTHN